MSHCLNSLKKAIERMIWWTIVGVSKGDARSVDYRSYPKNYSNFRAPGRARFPPPSAAYSP